MSFVASDIYLSSGTGSIENSWVEGVYKFTTSSFYNWEQDNEPIYDLEDRTSYLWNRLGFPVEDGFSGIPGLMFAVSADAPFTGESSGMIFKSVSAVIKVLPEVISVPIIIEVANFGNLGELCLNNLKFKDRGGLEIINRNFSKMDAYGLTDTNRSFFSSIGAGVGLLSGIDLNDTLFASKILSINTPVCSSTAPAIEGRFEGNNIVYACRSQGLGVTDNPTSAILSMGWASSVNGTTFHITNTSAFRTELVYDNIDYTASADLFITNYLTGTVNPATVRRTIMAAGVLSAPVVGYLYGNWFTKVSIKNCNGNIFIRNFAVDGGTGYADTLQHNTINGFEIESSKLLLENTLACRCKEAGFRIVNSDITLTRGIVATRNYTLSSAYARDESIDSAGIRIINSNIVVSSNNYSSGVSNIIHSTKNQIGIELFNTRWKGGQSREQTGTPSGITYIQTFYNKKSGIKVNGSYLEVPGRIDSYNNNMGIESTDSQILMNEGTFEFNQTYGIKAENSYIRYNQDLYKYTTLHSTDSEGQLHFQNNGVNLLLDNSNLNYTEGENLPAKYGKFYVKGSIGVANVSGTQVSLPNMQVFNGSLAKLVQPYISNLTGNLKSTTPIAGVLVSVKNGSKMICTGSKDSVSLLIGPTTYSLQKYVAGVYAGNASIVEFQGPTLICNLGVDVLAEDGSIINFSPPRDDHGNILIQNFNLSDALNHTKVELVSTKACLVANKNSVINMENLGDYRAFWPNTLVSAVDYNQSDAFGITSAVSGGYMQFYPNGQDQATIQASSGRYDVNDFNPAIVTDPVVAAHGGILLDWTAADSVDQVLYYSTGGMCVRALNGSIVNVKNVHFPAGWDNTSGMIYDVSSGRECDKLRIWNIGPNSYLNAAYCMVSGNYPSIPGYYGPSAVYLSSNGTVASAAHVATPDTFSLSLLDSYGASGSATARNYGPFRIFVSVGGPSKFLNYVSGVALIYNTAYQAWAQGYNPSGYVSAAPVVSSYYNDLTTSVFLTTSSMLDTGFRDRIRLDESAADMFANAKNGALGKSGRTKICTIYKNVTEEGGEAFDTGATQYGVGLLSVNIFDLYREC